MAFEENLTKAIFKENNLVSVSEELTVHSELASSPLGTTPAPLATLGRMVEKSLESRISTTKGVTVSVRVVSQVGSPILAEGRGL